jgi:hypothetical protein
MTTQTKTSKKGRNSKTNRLQVLNLKGNSESHPSLLGKPIRISKVRDARRLLGKLILEFQKGNIANQDAKDLCYLVTSYVNVAVQSDFEERLQQLEDNTK